MYFARNIHFNNRQVCKKQQKVVDEVALNIDYKFAFPNRGPSAMGHLAVVLDKVCFRCTSTKRVV